MNYLRENKRGFLFNVFFIGLFILVFNIFVFKNESNAMSTTMDISNLSEMQIMHKVIMEHFIKLILMLM